MSDINVTISQSFIDETLNSIDFAPFTVYRYPKEGVQDNGVMETEELFVDFEEDLKDYGMEVLSFVDESIDDEGNYVGALSNFGDNIIHHDPNSILEIYSKNIISEDEQDLLAEQISFMETFDALSFAAHATALYILERPNEFSSDAELVEMAKNIPAEGVEELVGFFKKFLGKAKRAVKKVFKYVKRKIVQVLKKVVRIGKPELKNLEIKQWGRPDVRIGNPIIAKGLNIRLSRLLIEIPYKWRFPLGRWYERTMRFTMTDRFRINATGIFPIKTDGNILSVHPQFYEFKTKIRVLGVWFSISMRSFVNKRLKKFNIYDVNKLVMPIENIGVKYSISSVKTIGRADSLLIAVNTDASSSS